MLSVRSSLTALHGVDTSKGHDKGHCAYSQVTRHGTRNLSQSEQSDMSFKVKVSRPWTRRHLVHVLYAHLSLQMLRGLPCKCRHTLHAHAPHLQEVVRLHSMPLQPPAWCDITSSHTLHYPNNSTSPHTQHKPPCTEHLTLRRASHHAQCVLIRHTRIFSKQHDTRKVARSGPGFYIAVLVMPPACCTPCPD